MNFIRDIFGAVDRRYLIRSYIISAAFLAYALWFFSSQSALAGNQKAVMFGYSILSAILFPFAKLVWDELRDMILGNNGIVHVGLLAIVMNFVLKMIVNVLLWFFAIGIAPLGILYLWLRNRRTSQ